jgi:hypothetical protein
VTPRRPNLFIVGAPRCGTTALTEFLRVHPDVCVPPVKEPHYFSGHLFLPPRFAAPRVVDEGSYLDLFAAAGTAKWLLDASPSYLYSAEAARSIHDFAPGARVVIMVRHPVDLMYALHSLADMAAAYKGEERLPSFAAVAEGREPEPGAALTYRQLASLSQVVRTYLDAFGRERVHIIVFDDLRDRIEHVHRSLLDFLGIDSLTVSLEAVPQSKRMASRRVRSARLEQWLRSPPAIGRPLHGLLPKRIRHGLGRWLRERNRPRRRPLAPELRRRLTESLRTEIGELGTVIGRDLGHWARG